MKAIVWTKYGPPEVLQLRELAKPAPRDREILVRIHAATVTTGDCELRSLRLPLYLSLPMRLMLGIRKPGGIRTPGTEFSGLVEAVGKDVTLYKEGQAVFGTSGLQFGTYAEYICLPEAPELGALALKPATLTHAQAACLPFGGLDALHFLRQANIQSGQKVAVVGAGGSIGTFAVQLARYYGAEVTAVDSAGKLDMLRSIGAEHVIDYTQDDFTRSGQAYDVIFDTVGKSRYADCLRALKAQGVYLLANPGPIEMFRAPWTALLGQKKVISGAARKTSEDLNFIKGLAETGKIKSVIDRSYPLEQIVEAHRYVESGRKKGNVVIQIIGTGDKNG